MWPETLIIVTWESTLQKIGWVTTTGEKNNNNIIHRPKVAHSAPNSALHTEIRPGPIFENVDVKLKKPATRHTPPHSLTYGHFSFNIVEYVMHVYSLTEINTLNLTTIYKVFAYVISTVFFCCCCCGCCYSSSFCMLVFINLFTY